MRVSFKALDEEGKGEDTRIMKKTRKALRKISFCLFHLDLRRERRRKRK